MILFYKNNYNSYAIGYANKISESKHKYISMDAWTVLFFQVLKVYYLCRVSLKTFRSLPGIPEGKNILPEGYNDQNFIYSQNEILLLRWLEIQ